MRVAVIDLGTFSALLLVAERRGKELVALHEERRTVDLVPDSRGRLSETACRRAMRALHVFERRARDYDVDAGITVATAAVRQATNRSHVVRSLRAASHWPLRVLTARQEAHLTAQGALIGLPRLRSRSLVVDIGGGSSEFILSGSTAFQSLDIGAAVATRDWKGRCPRKAAMRDLYYLTCAEKEVLRVDVDRFAGHDQLVGVGGSITTLAAIDLSLRRFDVKRVHGHALSIDWIAGMGARMSQMSQREIRRLIPFDPSRARVLLGGTYLWSGVLNRLNASRVTVSSRGLRWGVAARLTDLPFRSLTR